MESLAERVARPLFLGFFLVIAVILVTGGGRIPPVDFVSVGAWAIPLALLSIFFSKDLLPARLKAFLGGVADHPFVVLLVVFGLIAVTHAFRMMTFGVDVFDAGFLYQPILNAFSTPVLYCDGCYDRTFLAVHQSFTLFLVSPIAWIFGSPLAITVLPAMIGAGCFLILIRTYRAHLKTPLLTFLIVALLSIRGFRESFLFDFREDFLGAFFFFIGLALARSGRIHVALVALILAALSKETAAILLPFAGIAVLFEYRRKSEIVSTQTKLLYFAVCFGMSAFILLVSLPAWSPDQGGESDLVKRLAYLGSTPREIIFHILIHPIDSTLRVAGQLASIERVKYLVFLVAPFLYFVIRGFNFYYLPGIVLVFGNLMSASPQQRMMQFHYEILVLPFFAFGLAESLVKMEKSGKLSSRACRIALLIFLSVSGTWPASHLRTSLGKVELVSDYRWLRERAGAIPNDQIVLLDARTYPVLTDRKGLRAWTSKVYDGAAKNLVGPDSIGDAEVALVRKENADAGLGPEWRKLDCGPANFICEYTKVSPRIP